MPGVLPKIALRRSGPDSIELVVPEELADFDGERLRRRIAGLEQVSGQNVGWIVS